MSDSFEVEALAIAEPNQNPQHKTEDAFDHGLDHAHEHAHANDLEQVQVQGSHDPVHGLVEPLMVHTQETPKNASNTAEKSSKAAKPAKTPKAQALEGQEPEEHLSAEQPESSEPKAPNPFQALGLARELVAWASERKTVLSGLFWLLTVAAYIHYARGPRLSRYLLVLAIFGFCIMTKPVVVTLPLALLLLDYWPLERIGERRTEDRRRKTEEERQKASLKWLIIEKITD